MFPNGVFSTAFSTPAADAYFADRIYGDSWNNDKTLVSTLRALLLNRIGDNTLCVSIRNLSVNSGTYDSYSQSDVTALLHSKFDNDSNSFTIGYFCSSSSEGNEKMFRHAKEHFAEKNGWTRLDAISDFFKRSFDVLCFIDAEHRRTLFIVKGYDLRRHHYLPIAAFPSMPWFFDPAKGDRASEDEIALLNSLCENTPEKYLEALKKIASAVDFETAYVRKSLAGIDTAYERQRVDSLKAEVESSMRIFRNYQAKINEQLQIVSAKNIELMGLEDKIRSSDGKSELVDYFISNKRLKLDEVSDTRITFHVNTYLEYFDEAMADRNIQNRRSVVYEYAQDKDDAARLAKAAFIDQSIRIRTCAAYYVDIRGSFDAIESFSFGEDDYDRIPNPHINEYGCLGNYQYKINDCLERHDLIGVLEFAVASAKSINFGDQPVISKFFRKLYNGDGGKCFETEDGKQMDLKEVMAYLKAKEEEDAKDE